MLYSSRFVLKKEVVILTEILVPVYQTRRHIKIPLFLYICMLLAGARGGVVVKSLHYKPAGRGFDSG